MPDKNWEQVKIKYNKLRRYYANNKSELSPFHTFHEQMEILWGSNSNATSITKKQNDNDQTTNEDDVDNYNSIENQNLIEYDSDPDKDVKYNTIINNDSKAHHNTQNNKRKIIDNVELRTPPIQQKFIKRVNVITSSPASSSSTLQNQQLNHIDIFFQSMAETVKTFPPHLIAKTKMKVCNIVGEMELKALKGVDPLNDDDDDNTIEYLDEQEKE